LDGARLRLNDPARPGEQGLRRPIPAAQLERAWDLSSVPRQAIAIAAGDGVPELDFADPLGASAPVPAGPLEAAMVLPNLPPLPTSPLPSIGPQPPAAPPIPLPVVAPAAMTGGAGAPMVIVVTP